MNTYYYEKVHAIFFTLIQQLKGHSWAIYRLCSFETGVLIFTFTHVQYIIV